MIHDYTRKRGIVHSEILLPSNAPPNFQDRGTLWNSVEQIEKACNSQLARELEVALPIELSREEQVQLVRAYCSSQFISRGMCADFNIHDTGNGNPHAHILLTMRPMDAQGKWLPKSKKEYVLDESGERIRLPSGNFKTRKVDLVDWNSQENAEVWRKAWADLANEFLERNNRPERIDHRSYERQGIVQIPTVHIGVASSQMEKKGIATERGELNRSIKAANRLLRDIKAQIGKLKEWLLDVFKAKESLRTEPPQPKSPNLSTLLFRYLDIQKAKSGKYSQIWQQQHTADELKAISKAVNLLSEKGIYTLEELDAALSAVHDKASEIRSAMKPREARIKQLQKLIEQAQNFQKTQPIHNEYKQIRWKGKQEKFAEAHRADLAVWDAANRYLRANLPDMKLTPKAWQTELAALTAENEAEYAKSYRNIFPTLFSCFWRFSLEFNSFSNILRPEFPMCSTPVCGILCGQRQSLAGAIPAGLCGILGIPLFHSMNNTKTAPGPPQEVGCHNQRKQTARREIFREERSWRKGGCGVKRTPPYHTITLKLLRRANTVKNRSSKN